MAGFGGAVKLTGESEYKKALKQITQNLKEVSSQMKITSSMYDKSDKSTAALTAKSKDLNNVLTQQEKKVNTLTKQYHALSGQNQENIHNHLELYKQLKNARTRLEEIAKTSGKTSAEYKEQDKEVKKLEADYRKSSTAIEANKKSMSDARVELNKAKAEYSNITKEIEKNETALKESKSAYSQLTDTIGKQESKLEELKKEYANVVLEQGKNSKSARDLAVQIDSLSFELKENKTKMSDAEKAADKLDKSLDDVGKSAKNSSGGFTVLKGVISNLVTNGVQRLTSAITEQLGAAISRVDTINSYKKTMENLGYATEDVSKTTDELKSGIEGLPTTLPAIVSMQQQYAALSGNLDEATNLTLALNNATLAGGQGQEIANGALEQWYQIIAAGKPDLQSWKIINSAMPAQMNQIAESVMGAGKKSQDLFEAWKAGTVTTDQVKQALIRLNSEGGGSLASFKQQAQDSTGGIETSMTNVKTAIANALAGIIESIGQANIAGFFNSLKPVIKQVGNSFSELVKKVDWTAFGRTVAKGLESALQGFKWIIEHKNLVITALKLMVAGFAITHITAWTKSMKDAITGIVGFIGKTATFITSIQAKILAETSDTAALKANAASQMANNAASTAGIGVTHGLAAAQTGLNAAFAANPIGVVITGITTLISLFSIFSSLTNQASDSQENLTNELNEQQKAIEDNKKAWDDLILTQQENINAGVSEMAHYQALYDELTKIVDANGKVKSGYEERASFITSTLAEALGIEINTVNGVIQGYDKLRNSIGELIEAKKAQIILDAQKSSYEEALKKQTEAVDNLKNAEERLNEGKQKQIDLETEYNDYLKYASEIPREYSEAAREMSANYISDLKKRMEAQKQEVSEAQSNYDAQAEMFEKYTFTIGQYENNMALFHAKKYNEMSDATWDNFKEFQKTGDAKRAELENQIKTEEEHLHQLLVLQQKNGTDIYNTQIESSQRQLASLKEQLNQYNNATSSGLSRTKLIWSDNLAAQLSEILKSKVEFKDAGNDLVTMYINGVQMGEPRAKNEMANFANEMVQKVDKSNEAKNSGLSFLEGFRIGISDEGKQNRIYMSIHSMINKVIDTTNGILGIHSPSRVMKKTGQFLVQGLGLGIKSEENSILKQVSGFAENMIGTLNTGLSKEANLGVISTIKANLPNKKYYDTNLNNSNSKNKSYDAMVDAFKEALYDMKIELDDEVAGKFVEKTVARAIYS